jgi:dTMP kinase
MAARRAIHSGVTDEQPHTRTNTDGTWLAALAGRFIAFEGPDGSGKSTQLKRLIEALGAQGLVVRHVREPGGTPIGERVRQLLLDTSSEMTIRCEMLLYMASRAQLVEQTIRPALAKGEVVVADRFLSSTFAYQGAGGGVPAEEIEGVARCACGPTRPDLVLVFDVDEDTAARRTRGVEATKGRRKPVPAHLSTTLFDDRIELRGLEFRARVRQSYLAQAKAEPTRHIVLNAAQGPDEVWRDLHAALAAHRWG